MINLTERLSDRVAIVTGGGSGIGEATCKRLAAEGAKVAVADLNLEGAERVAGEIGDAAIAVHFDAGDTDSVAQMVATAVQHFGRLDILHNNAAIMASGHIALDTNPVDIPFNIWDKTFEVNMRGYLAGCKYAIPHMLAAGRGSIINTASGSAFRGDLGAIVYGSSKGAVVTFTKCVATIYGKQAIRCNAVSPGLIRSEGGKKNVYGRMVEILAENTLTPRLGEPEDIAAAVAFLASDDAEYITGTILDVDGGILCHHPYYSDVVREFGQAMAFGSAEGETVT